jgi:hypothetical protein
MKRAAGIFLALAFCGCGERYINSYGNTCELVDSSSDEEYKVFDCGAYRETCRVIRWPDRLECTNDATAADLQKEKNTLFDEGFELVWAAIVVFLWPVGAIILLIGVVMLIFFHFLGVARGPLPHKPGCSCLKCTPHYDG